MKNLSKFAYRIIFIAECISKHEEFAMVGFGLKLLGYLMIILSGSKISFKQVVLTTYLIAISAVLVLGTMPELNYNEDGSYANPASREII